MSQGDCFTPIARDAPGAVPGEHQLDAHRAVRYDGLHQARSVADHRDHLAARVADHAGEVVAMAFHGFGDDSVDVAELVVVAVDEIAVGVVHVGEQLPAVVRDAVDVWPDAACVARVERRSSSFEMLSSAPSLISAHSFSTSAANVSAPSSCTRILMRAL